MSEVSRSFAFNTALTATFDEKGKFDEAAHKEQVLPLRAKLMKNDGLTGCFIARYELEVQFLTKVTDVDAVTKYVREAIAWAAQQKGFFPLKGDKTPEVTLNVPKPVGDPSKPWLIVRFPGNIMNYQISSAGGYDDLGFKQTTHLLMQRMADHEGVIDHRLYLQSAAIQYRAAMTTVEQLKAHLQQVLTEAARGKFFPYITLGPDEELKLTFEEGLIAI